VSGPSGVDGANRDRTGDLLLAKAERERAAVDSSRVSADETGLSVSIIRISVGRIRVSEASMKPPRRGAARELRWLVRQNLPALRLDVLALG
jgi:hypothetical protein